MRCTSLPSPLVNRLGAAGLLVLAINELPDPQADLLESSEQLCNYIRRQARPDGSLACLDAADGKPSADPAEAVNAYPGVALYALMRSQKRRPAAWKTEVVRKAVGYYRPWWQAHKNMEFVPWQTAACAEAYLLTRDQTFADFTFEMNDWLCGLQYGLDPQHEMWMGGFKSWSDGRAAETPPTITTAFYAEGLADACRAAHQAGDLDRYQRYQGDLVMALQFTTRLQYTEADNQFADWYRPRLVGGFHASARDGVLRIDYSQHALSALLQYLDADLRIRSCFNAVSPQRKARAFIPCLALRADGPILAPVSLRGKIILCPDRLPTTVRTLQRGSHEPSFFRTRRGDAAGHGAAVPGRRRRQERDDSASEKLGIKLSLQCWTFNRLTFFETVDKAAELGVKYLEMFPGQKLKPDSKEKVHRTMSDDTIAAIKKKLTDAGGLKLVAYGVDSVPTDEAGRARTFEWAKKMGIEVLVTETHAQRHPRQALSGIPHQVRAAQPSEDLAARRGAEGVRGPQQVGRLLLRHRPLDAGRFGAGRDVQEAGRPRAALALQGPQRVRQRS